MEVGGILRDKDTCVDGHGLCGAISCIKADSEWFLRGVRLNQITVLSLR